MMIQISESKERWWQKQRFCYEQVYEDRSVRAQRDSLRA